MARFAFKAADEYALKLSKLAAGSDAIAKKAIYAGAEITANAIKSSINALPEEKYRLLRQGEKFSGIPQSQKRDLIASFGITPISKDSQGNHNAKLGFDGYGSMPTRKYKKGLPNQLLARSIESGSSIRQKRPFVRPAVLRIKKPAQEEMGRVTDEEIKKMNL